MTTSFDEELHRVKPIIVSNSNQNSISSSVGNSVTVRVPKSASSSFKRVSFGSSKGTVVETFVYESVPTIEEGYYGPVSPGGSYGVHKRLADAPLSKVKVKTLESQIPFSIPPPATVNAKLFNNGTVVFTEVEKNQRVSPSQSFHIMEDSENPFRPDGQLSHEVEPIVECYKTRPFPTGSDLVDGISGVTPTSSPAPSSPPGKKSKKKDEKAKNGGSSGAATKPQDIKLTLTTADGKNTQLEIQHKQLTSPRAGHVEVVHIGEKRKRCGCCSIQ